MPTASTRSWFDAYWLMLEKSPTSTITFTGILLLLIIVLLLSLILAFSPGLRTFLREVIKGVSYKEGKLAYDGTAKSDEPAIQTDEKGNVKPQSVSVDSQDNSSAQYDPTQDQIYWLVQMRFAWKDIDNPLTKVSECFENMKKISGPYPAPFVEAEYLLARFRCGDASALATLKAKADASADAYAANGVLARYYESIGEVDGEQKCLENRFHHAPDNTRKLASAHALAVLLAERSSWEAGVALLKEQLRYFQSATDQAMLWEWIGKIYESKALHWQSSLCFEKALQLNPDNTDLRFSLAYSYGERNFGKAMAAHHYQILLQQRPGDSMATNNLSVIYDEVNATSKKISLLRAAVHRKDNSYVAANLATAYARAGFIDDARGYLRDIPADEQQEPIVRAAYRNIRDQLEADEQANNKLQQLMKLEKSIVHDAGIQQLERQNDDLAHGFVGDWLLDDRLVLSIREDGGKLVCQMTFENDYYEYASYNVTTHYDPGILELDAVLDQKSLKERPTAKVASPGLWGGLGGFGALATNSLLSIGFNRPQENLKLVLVPGDERTLIGLQGTSSPDTRGGSNQAMLGSREVRFARLSPPE